MSKFLSIARSLTFIAAISGSLFFSAPSGCGGGTEGPAPTVGIKLVRLDNQELDLSAKPIPLTISLKVTFSEPMDTKSVEDSAALLDGSGNKVAGAFTWNADNTEVVFKPERKLLPRTTYKIQISTVAQSAAKAAISAVDQQFVTMTAGDVNGDGVPDIVVSATSLKGSVYLYSGADLGTNPIVPMTTISGEINTLLFGEQVAMAGDVDADGYADIIVSMPTYPDALTAKGAVYFFSGKNLFDTTPVSKTASDADAVIFGREVKDFRFGNAISGGFDVNGDGYDDVIISEYGDYIHDILNAVYVFSGNTLTGTKKAVDAMYVVTDANKKLFGNAISGLKDFDDDGKDDIMINEYGNIWGGVYVFRARDLTASTDAAIAAAVIEPSVTMYMFGYTISSAGDVNLDGTEDIIIGAIYEGLDPSSMYVFSGKDIPSSGTINLDENKVIMAVKNIPGSDTVNAEFSGAGDIDGDGQDDIIIGAPHANLGGDDIGETWIYGLDSSNVQKTLADLTISGATSPYYFGRSVSGIGDIDGDDKPDIAVSATGVSGYVHIFSGASLTTGPKYTIAGSTTGEILGQSVSGAFR